MSTLEGKTIPTKRTGSFVRRTLAHNEALLQGGDVLDLMASFADTPLDDCLATLSAHIDLEELVIAKGVVRHKSTKARAKDKLVRTFSGSHWIQWLSEREVQLSLAQHGLALVFVSNRFRQDTGCWEQRGGDHHTIIDGELLLISTQEPERSIVFVARGDTYIDMSSDGYVSGNYIAFKPVMYVNGELFWDNFELPESMRDYEFGTHACKNCEDTGLPTAEARAEALQELVASTFPGVELGFEFTLELLQQISYFFADDERPWGIGP